MVASTPDASKEPRWILVADQDEASARRLVTVAARRGLKAHATARGHEALRVAGTRRLVLAVIDVALEDMTGHELTARLKAIDPGLPVMMTTGDFRPELEVMARQLGIVSYAQKPVGRRRLEAVLDKLLSARLPLARDA